VESAAAQGDAAISAAKQQQEEALMATIAELQSSIASVENEAAHREGALR
jgi:hypothetical protein